MDDIPYLARGVNLLGTDSSVLVSSSKYLNSPRLREWIAFIALKKNGPDFPPAAEMYQLLPILNELRDFDQLLRLTERCGLPELQRRYSFAALEPGSLVARRFGADP